MWWPPLPVRLPQAGMDSDGSVAATGAVSRAAAGRPTHRLLLLDVEGTSAARMVGRWGDCGSGFIRLAGCVLHTIIAHSVTG